MQTKFFIQKTLIGVVSFGTLVFLTGCATPSFTKVGTSVTGEKIEINKKDVHAQTKMSESIFLEPVAAKEQIIYFKIRSTSDENLNIAEKLEAELEKKGFKVTQDPSKANFMIQANLLKVGEIDENEQRNYLGAGFGVGAVAAGATILTGGGGSQAGKAGLIGVAVGLAVEAARVKDIHYALVTDVEIRQRPIQGELISQTDKQVNDTASSSVSTQTSNLNGVQWKKYRTRIVSSAYAPGLEFKQAQRFLEDGLVKALSGTM
ncbi:MAG: complement resistance protein TraT [Halarcobacter sp.]